MSLGVVFSVFILLELLRSVCWAYQISESIVFIKLRKNVSHDFFRYFLSLPLSSWNSKYIGLLIFSLRSTRLLFFGLFCFLSMLHFGWFLWLCFQFTGYFLSVFQSSALKLFWYGSFHIFHLILFISSIPLLIMFTFSYTFLNNSEHIYDTYFNVLIS